MASDGIGRGGATPASAHEASREASERRLQLCGHECPFPTAESFPLEPCPLERAHDGGHVYWMQTRPQAKRGVKNAIWVVDQDGATVLHAIFDGGATAEDVCALMALQQVVAERMAAEEAEPA